MTSDQDKAIHQQWQICLGIGTKKNNGDPTQFVMWHSHIQSSHLTWDLESIQFIDDRNIKNLRPSDDHE